MIEQTPTTEQTSASQAPVQNQPPQPMPAPQQVPPVNGASESLRRSPFLAAVLSLMPGLGQVYLGYYQLGFVNAVVIASLLTLLATGDLGPLTPLASVFMAFFWLYNIVDAGRRAVMVNEALAGRGSIELPKDFAAPGLKGSVMGGTILVLIGAILLGRTLLGVSLEWTEEWWPVAIVLFGGYLIYKAKSEAGSRSPDPDNED